VTDVSEPTLIELLRGKGAHVDPMACVEDLSADWAGKKLTGHPHTIWQILGHISYWMDYEVKRIAGKRPTYPEHAAESWPADDGPANEDAWISEIARFSSLLEELSDLATLSAEKLDGAVERLHPSQSTRVSTVRAVLWQIVAHNSYHVGQIVLLRQGLGKWPARKGGDTW
jgi:uncharacterized damage-inducible protein DinB